MTDIVVKTIQVLSVFPGRFGGAIVKGVVVGERAELRSKIDWKVAITLPRPGEFWQMTGRYCDHELYGKQLNVIECQPVKLPEERYVASLLANHPAFSGFYFGPKKIAALLNEFGHVDLVKHLNDGNVNLLSKVIQSAIATEVVKSWRSLNNEVETINFLLSYRFSPELARKVLSLCRDDAVKRLKANPYALVCFGELSRSIWRTVEVCAAKVGLSPDNENRLVGAVEYVLYKSLFSGHTTMPLPLLLKASEKLLKSRKRAEQGVRLALMRRLICVVDYKPEPLIQLYGPAVIEMQLERHINNLLSGPKQLLLFGSNEIQLKILIDSYCSSEGTFFHFNEQQRAAILMALSSRFSILTGFGGTGKTTVLRAVIDIAKILRRDAHLIALAGKAKERARQATGHKAFTIHAFLAAVKRGTDDIKLEGNPLVIVDEASMVDVSLFNELLSVMEHKQYSLLIVGDPAQISPVGFGLVLHRLVSISGFPSVHLTEVHRQQTVLHKVAMAVREFGPGRTISIPEWRGENEGIFHISACKSDLCKKILSLKQLEHDGILPTLQILTPHMMERMPDSGIKINRYLQKELTSGNDGIRLGTCWLRVGDPVIVSENNYDLGLFNGMTGRLNRLENTTDTLAGFFTFDGHEGEVRLTTEDLFDLAMKPAYAISIHKSQGSEYDAVIITCVADSPMVERSLIYTALTRAKRLCLVVGAMGVFQDAVEKPNRAETICAGLFLSKLQTNSFNSPSSLS